MLEACAEARGERLTKGVSWKVRTLKERIQQLITQRKACGAEESSRRKSLCKEIKKLIREKIKLCREARIDTILTEFRGLREIKSILEPQKKQGIACVAGEDGAEHTCRESIAEVFASFYEKLYTNNSSDRQVSGNAAVLSAIQPFSIEELLAALKKMKAGKAKDASGVVAEMLKHGGGALQTSILELFNEVLAQGTSPPDSWRQTRLKVIFKKGDPKLPKNYRPIAILPILYKLFSRMLCHRLQDDVLGAQSPDQAAYRPGYSTEDHLLSMTLLYEHCREWNQELWLGMVDFEKAFDTVDHAKLWVVLSKVGVDACYVDILQRLYACQHAVVDVGVESRKFCLKRGVKQGDPISGLLFLAVVEVCFSKLCAKWRALNARRTGQYYGFVLDTCEEPFTNLRFADDVLLLAQSCADARKMIDHLKGEAEKYGLKLNASKTKILTTATRTLPGSVMVGSQRIEILSHEDSERYLGRKLSLGEYHMTELRNRISSAWAAFHNTVLYFIQTDIRFLQKQSCSNILLRQWLCMGQPAGP